MVCTKNVYGMQISLISVKEFLHKCQQCRAVGGKAGVQNYVNVVYECPTIAICTFTFDEKSGFV